MTLTLVDLPVEIISYIFRLMHGREILRCRAVSTQWRDAVDALTDMDWKHICAGRFQSNNIRAYYEKIHRKNGISWKDTYKAVNSWPNVGSSVENVQLLASKVQRCKVLPKGIVACLQNHSHRNFLVYDDCFSDTIVYYNTKTLSECKRKKFNFVFSSLQFDENDDLLVLIRLDRPDQEYGRLCVIIKKTKKIFYVRQIGRYKGYSNFYSEFSLLGKQVLYKDKNWHVCMSTMVEEDGNLTVNTVKLSEIQYPNNFVDYQFNNTSDLGRTNCCNHHQKLHLLTDEGTLFIQNENNDSFEIFARACNGFEYNIETLQFCGFDWTHRAFKHYLTDLIFYAQCDVIITGNNVQNGECVFNKLHIYYAPTILKKHSADTFHITTTKQLNGIDKETPTKTIDLTAILKGDSQLHEVDFIETGYNHKLVINCNHTLYIIELNPEYLKPTVKKRKRRHAILKMKRQIVCLNRDLKMNRIKLKRLLIKQYRQDLRLRKQKTV